MDYEIEPYEEGMEDFFCRVENGEIVDISYIQTYECPTPCIDEDGKILPLDDDHVLVNDGFTRTVIPKEDI